MDNKNVRKNNKIESNFNILIKNISTKQNISTNQIIYKEINVNKVLCKTLTTTNLNFKNMIFLFKSVKHKEGWVGELVRSTFGSPSWQFRRGGPMRVDGFKNLIRLA